MKIFIVTKLHYYIQHRLIYKIYNLTFFNTFTISRKTFLESPVSIQYKGHPTCTGKKKYLPYFTILRIHPIVLKI